MNRKVYTSMILVLMICLFSCNSSISHKPLEIIKEIPENRQNDYMRAVKFDIEKLLNLDDLEKGFDSIEIRLWFANSTNKEKLIIIQKVKSKSSVAAYNLTFKYQDSTRLLEYIEKNHYKIVEKYDSDKLLNNLLNMGILKLPDMSEIPNYSRTFDGTSITVEYAKIDHYKIYSYQNPQFESDSFWQAKTIVEIAKYLEKELQLELLSSER